MSSRRLLLPALLLAGLVAPPGALACLPQSGHVGRSSIRGVRVGATARMPANAVSASYCVDGGARLAFAVDRSAAVVLVASTAVGDQVGGIAPGALVRPDELEAIGSSASADLYRLGGANQIVLGVRGRRVQFVAAADRLLLESRGRLAYWVAKLGL